VTMKLYFELSALNNPEEKMELRIICLKILGRQIKVISQYIGRNTTTKIQ